VTVILETDRLRLRTWTPDDAEAAFPIYSDPEVMRFLSTFARNLDDVRAIVQRRIDHQERHGFTIWAVVEKATSGLVGACGLKHLDDGPEIEVGYHLARPAWGKGYATEAARACLRHGFDRLGLPRIVAVVDPLNHASQRVIEKIGLKFERMGRYYNKELRYYAAQRGDPAG
jgi:RimJ/RimL family protein N-acetyltransferase